MKKKGPAKGQTNLSKEKCAYCDNRLSTSKQVFAVPTGLYCDKSCAINHHIWEIKHKVDGWAEYISEDMQDVLSADEWDTIMDTYGEWIMVDKDGGVQ